MRASRQHRMRRARFLTGQTRSPGGVRCRVPPLRPFVDPDSSPTAPPTCATPITQMEHRCCCSINAGAMNAPGRTRTCDRRLRRPMLYPAELQAQRRGKVTNTVPFDLQRTVLHVADKGPRTCAVTNPAGSPHSASSSRTDRRVAVAPTGEVRAGTVPKRDGA